MEQKQQQKAFLWDQDTLFLLKDLPSWTIALKKEGIGFIKVLNTLQVSQMNTAGAKESRDPDLFHTGT